MAARLADCGVAVERVGLDPEGHVDLGQALRALAARGVTRVFSEGGPKVAGRLIDLSLADDVVLITAEKPLGRPGQPSLGGRARAALLDPRRYSPVDRVAYGPDVMLRFERTPKTAHQGDGMFTGIFSDVGQVI